MTGAKLDPARCPLCGESNECAMVEGKPTCWCFEELIPADVLQRVPPEAQGVVCVCKSCVKGKRAPARTLEAIQELLRRRS